MTATSLSQPALRNASISSSQVSGVNALYFSGRLMVMRATPPFTSNRMSLYCAMTRSPVHGEAARHADGLAGDIGRVVRQQERHDARIILRLAEPAHRDGALEPFRDLGAVRTVQETAQDCGVGRPRAQRVDDHALAYELARHRLGKRDHAALAGGIDCLAGRTHPASVGGD